MTTDATLPNGWTEKQWDAEVKSHTAAWGLEMTKQTEKTTTKDALWMRYKIESDKVDDLYSAAKKQERKAHAVWLKWKRTK